MQAEDAIAVELGLGEPLIRRRLVRELRVLGAIALDVDRLVTGERCLDVDEISGALELAGLIKRLPGTGNPA